ncbi:hypothetical protein GCM10027342_05380 [Photobacterium alginatilyticum]
MKGKSFVLGGTLLSMTLSACYSTGTNRITNNLVGIWESNTYGLFLEISEHNHKFYRSTGNICLAVPLNEMIGFNHEELLNNIILSDDRETIITTLGNRKTQGIEMVNISDLPNTCRKLI